MYIVTSARVQRLHTSSASKVGRIWHTAPDQSEHMRTLTIPCTWCRGSVDRMWSSSDQPHASTRARTCASMLACVVTTPFGRPVVPDVYSVGAPARVEVREQPRGAGRQQGGGGEEGDASLPGRGSDALGQVGVHHHRLGLRVVHDVGQLRCRMGHRHGYGDAACPPDSEVRGHPVPTRRDQQPDPGLVEVVASGQQAGGRHRGGRHQVVVGVDSLRRGHRQAVPCSWARRTGTAPSHRHRPGSASTRTYSSRGSAAGRDQPRGPGASVTSTDGGRTPGLAQRRGVGVA